jgi:hypothetical protein
MRNLDNGLVSHYASYEKYTKVGAEPLASDVKATIGEMVWPRELAQGALSDAKNLVGENNPSLKFESAKQFPMPRDAAFEKTVESERLELRATQAEYDENFKDSEGVDPARRKNPNARYDDRLLRDYSKKNYSRVARRERQLGQKSTAALEGDPIPAAPEEAPTISRSRPKRLNIGLPKWMYEFGRENTLGGSPTVY